MREHPIIFSAPMVRAILEGRKTQTRRVCKGQRDLSNVRDFRLDSCPYGQPGDRLWVRETTVNVEKHGYLGPVYLESEDGRATLDGGLAPAPDDMTEVEPWEITLRPSIHMPRSMCRLVLEITDVRVERVQDINERDARAEGARYHDGFGVGHSGWRHDDGDVHDDARSAFARLWDSINAKRGFGWFGWNGNPWVWALTFRRVEDGDA